MLDVPVDNRAQRQAPPDVRLAALADRQHGIVTARQLRALDVEDTTLALLRRGYRVLRLTWEQVPVDEAQGARRIRLALGEAHRS